MIFKILLINLLLLSILIFQFKVRKIRFNFNVNYFFSLKKIIYSFIITFLFFFIFIFLLRICRVFYINSHYLDLKKLIFFFNFIDFSYFLLFFLFLFLFFFSLKNLIVSFFKLHFLTVYFYFFKELYIIIIYFSNLDIIFSRLFPNKTRPLIFFLLNHGLKIMLFFLIFNDLLLNNFVLHLSLTFLPFYGLYYIIYNIMYFFKNLKVDFDQGFNMQLRKISISTGTGLNKLYEYQKYLILGKSKFYFLNEHDIYENEKRCLYYTFPTDFKFLI